MEGICVNVVSPDQFLLIPLYNLAHMFRDYDLAMFYNICCLLKFLVNSTYPIWIKYL